MKTLLQAFKRKCRRLAALLFLVISSLIPWHLLPSSNDLAGAFKRGCRLIDRIESAVVLKLYTLLRGLALDRGLIGQSGAAGWRHERDLLQEVMSWAARTLDQHGGRPRVAREVAKVLHVGSGSASAGHREMNTAFDWHADDNLRSAKAAYPIGASA